MSPFDDAKYNALLEGLEITEMTFSSLEETFRVDSEYYQKDLLKLLQRKLSSIK